MNLFPVILSIVTALACFMAGVLFVPILCVFLNQAYHIELPLQAGIFIDLVLLMVIILLHTYFIQWIPD